MRKAFWHKESWESLVNELLPTLLSERLEVIEYRRREVGEFDHITVGVRGSGTEVVNAVYEGIPRVDDYGVFVFDDTEVVVVPRADTEELEHVRCCGEQMIGFLEERIASPPENFLTGPDTLSTWLPLSDWFREFFLENAQILDTYNFISRYTHLNRIIVENVGDVAPASQIGRICPIESPEGPNCGRVITIAEGAVIKKGQIVIEDGSPAGALGFSASMIPFLEHSDPARLLMGANMQRQWLPPARPEPALVRTGMEPEDPEFWCGYNLLTAFVSWGVLGCEDGLVLSQSAAGRMAYNTALEIGDKLSDRHGQKGVISAILPNDEMPRLPDGSVIDIICSFIGIHTRMNAGRLLEAVAGRIAYIAGKPYAAPPFASPGRARLSEEMADVGLPSDGMEKLTIPGNPEEPCYSSLTGYVYWGRTHHNVAGKLWASVRPEGGREPYRPMRIGEMEYYILRDSGLFRLIAENVGVRDATSAHAGRLADAIAAGEPIPDSFPSTPLLRLKQSLKSAGIILEIGRDSLRFDWDDDGTFAFPIPLQHPWCQSRLIESLAPDTSLPLWQVVAGESRKLESLLKSDAPTALVAGAKGRLRECLEAYMSTLIQTHPSDLFATGKVLFSMKSVIVPSAELGAGCVGIPEEAAWELFGPLACRAVDPAEIAGRTQRGEAAIDSVMAASHVMLYRAPSIEMTSAVAFKPVRVSHRAVELNPLVCKWINGDFDGDQAGIYLPLAPEAQREIEQKMTVAGHLKRDPGLIDSLVPPHEAIWGLSLLSLTGKGRKSIAAVAGDIRIQAGVLTQWELTEHIKGIMFSQGVERAIQVLEELMKLGFQAARGSGASYNPFAEIGQDEMEPNSRDRVHEHLESSEDYVTDAMGPQLLCTKAAIRGTVDNLVKLYFQRHNRPGIGTLHGLDFDEFADLTVAMRRHIAAFATRWEDLGLGKDFRLQRATRATAVLGRATRAANPGIVFGSAASRGEIDPLTDRDARLYAGLLPL